jgi:citrate lyase subunit beta / citryl-CoA lyase
LRRRLYMDPQSELARQTLARLMPSAWAAHLVVGSNRSLPPVRSWLYAPGNNPKLLERVFSAGADAVILDLEDAVPPDQKERARQLVAEVVRARAGRPGPALFVRVNHPDTGLGEADLHAVVGPGLDGLRVPKVEGAETARQVDDWISQAEARNSLEPGGVALVCNVESAAGVWRADAIAAARPRVLALAFGGVDFGRDIGATTGPDGVETLYARSHLVLASRVAGVRPPIDGVYTQLADEAGLERTTQQARALGFFGRSAIHPRQVAVINRIFTPTADELAWAGQVIDTARKAEQALASGAVQLATGEFVDVAVVRRAEALVQLAAALRAARSNEEVQPS